MRTAKIVVTVQLDDPEVTVARVAQVLDHALANNQRYTPVHDWGIHDVDGNSALDADDYEGNV